MKKGLPLRPDSVQRAHAVQELSESRKRHTGFADAAQRPVCGVKDEERGRETYKKEKQRLKRRKCS